MAAGVHAGMPAGDAGHVLGPFKAKHHIIRALKIALVAIVVVGLITAGVFCGLATTSLGAYGGFAGFSAVGAMGGLSAGLVAGGLFSIYHAYRKEMYKLKMTDNAKDSLNFVISSVANTALVSCFTVASGVHAGISIVATVVLLLLGRNIIHNFNPTVDGWSQQAYEYLAS